MLLELRALADAVLIGTGTLRAEGYDRLGRSEERRRHRRALGLPDDPVAVLLSRGLDPAWDRGVRALLCEGGPTLNRALLAQGLVDELFLTLSPQLTGEPGAPRIVEGEGLDGPARARPVWVLRAGGELF